MSFEVETTGFEDAKETLRDIENDLRGGSPWVVGTGVEYAVYLEFGTKYMDPKPFFRPAVLEIRAKGIDGFVADHTSRTVEDINDLDELVAVVALALERRIKEIITDKGLIDTGTMRASVAAIPGADPDVLPGISDIPDTGSGPPYPDDVGEAARAGIEI